MQLYEMQVTKTAICRAAPAKIPRGIVGAAVAFRFSPEWENLSKTVVFRAGSVTKDVLQAQDTAVIPAECTREAGALLEVGVYGTDAENTVAIPTLWAAVGRVCEATDPSGDETTDPSLPVWAQLQEQIDQLERQGVTQNEVGQAVTDYMTAHPVTAKEIGAAPDGYGLGGFPTTQISLSELDSIYASGWYWLVEPGATRNGVYFNYATVFVHGMEDGACVQEIHPLAQTVTLTRTIYAGVAGEWACSDPPMAAGVEYRTTESRNGNPVYTMLVDCGELASGGTFTFAEGVTTIRYAGFAGGVPLPHVPSGGFDDAWTLWMSVNGGTITVYGGSGYDGATITTSAQVWYTKQGG